MSYGEISMKIFSWVMKEIWANSWAYSLGGGLKGVRMLRLLQKILPFSQFRPYLLRYKPIFLNVLGANPLSKVTVPLKS